MSSSAAYNKRFGISERSYNLIIDALARRPEIERAVIFGSRAMGTAKRGSDIDLAIFGSSVTQKTASELSRELNERLPIPYAVDVLAYHLIEDDAVRSYIEIEGVVFYAPHG